MIFQKKPFEVGPEVVQPGPLLVQPQIKSCPGWTRSGPGWTKSGPGWTRNGPTSNQKLSRLDQSVQKFYTWWGNFFNFVFDLKNG